MKSDLQWKGNESWKELIFLKRLTVEIKQYTSLVQWCSKLFIFEYGWSLQKTKMWCLLFLLGYSWGIDYNASTIFLRAVISAYLIHCCIPSKLNSTWKSVLSVNIFWNIWLNEWINECKIKISYLLSLKSVQITLMNTVFRWVNGTKTKYKGSLCQVCISLCISRRAITSSLNHSQYHCLNMSVKL